MPFSPEEIETRRFLVALRGYDKDQVDAFLRELAADYREVLTRAQVSEKIPASSALDPFQVLGEEVASVVRAAAERVNELAERAQREAGEAREAARQELEAAAEQRREGEQQAQKIRARPDREVAAVWVRAAEEVAP